MTNSRAALADRIEGSLGPFNFISKDERAIVVAALRAPPAVEGGADESRMEKISALIARLQSTKDQFGDTCVYIRRGGLSWGAVALNRRSDDQKHGVFDLQAQHDRDMEQRVGQVERLITSKNAWMDRANKAEAALSQPQIEGGAVRGWAILSNGKIYVRTVSDTRRAAIINWLVTEKQVGISAAHTDDDIERMWKHHGCYVDCREVSISAALAPPQTGDGK